MKHENQESGLTELYDLTPIGNFILDNIQGIQTNNGMYYHYADVCNLLKKRDETIQSNPYLIFNEKEDWLNNDIKTFIENVLDKNPIDDIHRIIKELFENADMTIKWKNAKIKNLENQVYWAENERDKRITWWLTNENLNRENQKLKEENNLLDKENDLLRKQIDELKKSKSK